MQPLTNDVNIITVDWNVQSRNRPRWQEPTYLVASYDDSHIQQGHPNLAILSDSHHHINFIVHQLQKN